MNTPEVLCYIDRHASSGTLIRAYFTDDIKGVSGDDWNDAPWYHNAGPPSSECTEIVADIGEYSTQEFPSLSVDQINAGEDSWLEARWYPAIYAGVTIREFRQMIENAGGQLYIPMAKLESPESESE